jgi:hypothetical protein
METLVFIIGLFKGLGLGLVGMRRIADGNIYHRIGNRRPCRDMDRRQLRGAAVEE